MLPDDTRRVGALFLIFLRLGLTSFGGPIAHLAYFRAEFVVRRGWLSERQYAELVALCQLLPGPASSQVGMALGMGRAGYGGALAAWAGFTLPSAILLTLLALGMTSGGTLLDSGVIHGLKIMTVAVVAQAVHAMARQHCASPARAVLMAIGCGWILLMPDAWTQLALIGGAAIAGILLFKPVVQPDADALPASKGARAGACWLVTFLALLLGLPILSAFYGASSASGFLLAQFDTFYRVGALVFGGGHVVLPMLQSEVVNTGWISPDLFVAGYGAAQAVPGPLFTFAAFLGASGGAVQGAVAGWTGAAVCLAAIFIPSFLLVAGVLPFWARLRRNLQVQAALTGINAAVVGLLLAALYQPVWTSAIHDVIDVALALLALAALTWWKRPVWQVVIASALIGWLAG